MIVSWSFLFLALISTTEARSSGGSRGHSASRPSQHTFSNPGGPHGGFGSPSGGGSFGHPGGGFGAGGGGALSHPGGPVGGGALAHPGGPVGGGFQQQPHFQPQPGFQSAPGFGAHPPVGQGNTGGSVWKPALAGAAAGAVGGAVLAHAIHSSSSSSSQPHFNPGVRQYHVNDAKQETVQTKANSDEIQCKGRVQDLLEQAKNDSETKENATLAYTEALAQYREVLAQMAGNITDTTDVAQLQAQLADLQTKLGSLPKDTNVTDDAAVVAALDKIKQQASQRPMEISWTCAKATHKCCGLDCCELSPEERPTTTTTTPAPQIIYIERPGKAAHRHDFWLGLLILPFLLTVLNSL